MKKDSFKYMPNWRSSIIPPHASIRDALEAISSSGAFMACVVSKDGTLEGIMTDSDVRHALLQGAKLTDEVVAWNQKNPVIGREDASPGDLISLAKLNSVREIPLIDAERRLVDIFILLNHQDRVPVQESTAPDPSPRHGPVPNQMLILAGGLGTRLRPLVNDRPKPLAIVGDKPILETLLMRASASGIHNFFIAVNYMAEQIEEFLASPKFSHLNIEIARETKRLGTAGAIGMIKEKVSHPLLVCNADVLTTVPFQQIIRHHVKEKADITCSVRSFDMTVPYGVVEVKDGRILNLREKPRTTHLVNAGIYLLNPEICRTVPAQEYLDMPDLIEASLKKGCLVAPFLLHEYWVDIGKPEDFTRANSEYQSFFGDMS